ncbi:MAG: cyclic nucleotide-binding domain-containing protein [Candidatus Gracilibacteria bacterium]|nr:cyclic nucleotide-binding domain-containing protein [Candidatus Gracilibacteria bacterium]MDD2909120.1 cyclic nucleotide-binding domain-containing protein [Candidatus Gracilibacteria bacterium]
MKTEKILDQHPENNNKKEVSKVSAKDAIGNLRDIMKVEKTNPIIAYLDKFDTYFKKKKRVLEVGQILFSPGKDDNMYIIITGGVDILRYTSDGQKKEIGKARAGSFIGEGIIFDRNQKDVEAIANSPSEIFALTKEDLKKLEQESPAEALELYKYIIEVTNKRLLDSGKELADIYEATNKLIEMAKNGEKGFSDIMAYTKGLLGVDYIIFVENHPAIDGFFYYKYSTDLKSLGNLNKKSGSEINTNLGGVYDSKNPIFGTNIKDSVYIIPLKNNDKLKGYFVAGKKKGVITDNEMRISSNIGPLIGSIIESNQNQADTKAKSMSKNYFDNGLSSI